MRDWFVASIAAGVVAVFLAAGNVIDDPATAAAVTSTDSVTPTAERIKIGKKVAKDETSARRLRSFTFRERRAMGAYWSNIRRIMDDLSAKGELDSDPGCAMLQVVAVLKAENPKGWQAAEDIPPAEIDWDKLFEFIERLIALIMAMFS